MPAAARTATPLMILLLGLGTAAAAPAAAADSVPSPDRSGEPSVRVTTHPLQALEQGGGRAGLAHASLRTTVDLPTAPGVLGVTWTGKRGSADPIVQVRTLTEGAWSEWSDVDVDGQSVSGSTPGTEPVPFGGTDRRAQVRVSGAIEPEVTVVSSRTTDADRRTLGALPGAATGPGGEQSHAPGRTPSAETTSSYPVNGPIIATRSQWGADESISTWRPRAQEKTLGVTIHHTAGLNGQAPHEIPSTLRAIHHYHAEVRGWGDIGYNVLIDPYGRAWEGRKGGLNNFIVGGHAAGVNSMAYGVSMMGNFTDIQPSADQRGATALVTGWALAAKDVDPASSFTAHNKYLKNGGGTYDAIHGHRDTAWTACPGDTFWQTFGSFRQQAAAFASRELTAVQRAEPAQHETIATVNAHLQVAFPLPSESTTTVYASHWADRSRAVDTALRATREGRPSLLVSNNAVPAAAKAELQRLGAREVVITSPPSQVDDRAVRDLESMGLTVRYEAQEQVADSAIATSQRWEASGTDAVYLANGEGAQADVLTGGAAAAHQDAPLLLTGDAGISEATLARLRELQPSTVNLVGGRFAISEATEQAVRAAVPGASVVRMAGTTASDTSAEVARQAWGAGGANGTVVVNAADHNPSVPTALHVAAALDDPIVLSDQSCQSVAVRAASEHVGATMSTLAGNPTRTDWSAGTTACAG